MSGNILIVDDDNTVLEILEKTLVDKGHDVRVAADGAQALKLYRKESPDMVVLDVMLPDMDGRDVLRQMRKTRPEADSMPVLFLSASSDMDTKVSALQGGAQDFLVKPFSLREFNTKVAKVLSEYRRAKDLEEKKVALEAEVSERKENYKRINRELKKQLLSMKTLFAVSQDLNRRLDIEELINGLALTLVGELQISSIAIFMPHDDERKSYKVMGLKGFKAERLYDMTLDVDGELVQWLLSGKRPQKLVRSGDKNWVGRLPDVRLAVFEYVSPIMTRQSLEGMVFAGPKINARDYTSFDLELLHSVCNSAAVSLENARLFQELQGTYLSTVKALVSLIEAKDAYTKGHTERVADYSVALGKRMSLSREQLREIAFGAVLHDIGKLIIYESILNKPGNLNREEWEALKKHPEVGASIIENMDFLSETVALVRHHHEQWDGKGYPDGLKGDEIPVGARIIAVCDCFDAMTTNRSYRKALTWKKTLHTLRSKSGTQFDPLVVQCFIEMLETGFRPRSFDTVTFEEEM